MSNTCKISLIYDNTKRLMLTDISTQQIQEWQLKHLENKILSLKAMRKNNKLTILVTVLKHTIRRWIFHASS
jgi:hypothetical protein